ncbi:hypothetical protein L484_008085 [Morus notabilis]|uniref:Uncharacterized protein n=1 Tax=Morus notabilis TaxID=981085 RepID=W9R2Y3_9ROSA|nr:uncharacterized protein LOC21391465 [Morus notabilis]EXB66340.1 hypothetical protein L484_008085 [Morus notabilis]
MRSISQLQSARFHLHYSQPKRRNQLEKAPKLLPFLSSNDKPVKQQFRRSQGRTKAIRSSSTSHLILSLTSPAAAKSPDISTLIQISAILLVLYFLSNFVVPDLLSKYFEFDKADENQKGRDDSDVER